MKWGTTPHAADTRANLSVAPASSFISSTANVPPETAPMCSHVGMNDMSLGRLERIEDIRTIWQHERHDFSDWLLNNAEQLAEVLGIELELENAEEPVGDFWLDLIGRDLTHGAVLIVENQLEATDHSHLGQVLLYAAGTGAGTIVWVAKQFRAEHRQALNWLNESTDEGFHFFGVEVAAVRIGDSPPAPLLTLVVQPSDSQKQVRERADASRLSGKARLYAEFWARFIERVNIDYPKWTRRRSVVRSDNWLDFPSGISGTYFAASFAQGARLRHELYIDCGDADRNLALFKALEAQRDALENHYGRPLIFEALPDRRATRVADYLDGADVSQSARHDEFIDWFFDAGERLRRAVAAATLPAA